MDGDRGPRFELLMKHLGGKNVLNLDDLSIVLKAHMILETFLEEIIYDYYKSEKAKEIIENLNVGFSKKVDLLEKFNLLNISTSNIDGKKCIKILRDINKLRNKFAHNLEVGLLDCDDILNEIFPYFEDSIRKIVKDDAHYQAVNDHRRTKFALCVAYLGGAFDEMLDEETGEGGSPL